MITAEEARELSSPTLEEECNFFDPYIRSAARERRYWVLVDHENLIKEAMRISDKWGAFIEIMKRKYGYNVSLFYNESASLRRAIKISWQVDQ